MDHFCPWMDNCVGFGNYKHYLLFVIYATFNTNFTFYHLLHALMFGNYNFGQRILMCDGLVLSFVLSLPLASLLGFHSVLVAKNMTTIEFCQKRTTAGGGGLWLLLEAESRYDLGVLQNIKSVAGENIFTWLLPIGKPSGNGLEWPLPGEELSQHLQQSQTGDANSGLSYLADFCRATAACSHHMLQSFMDKFETTAPRIQTTVSARSDTSSRTAEEQIPEHSPEIPARGPVGGSSSSHSSSSNRNSNSTDCPCIFNPISLETHMKACADQCTSTYACITEALGACSDLSSVWRSRVRIVRGATAAAPLIQTMVSELRPASGI